MKKVVILALAILMVFSFTACGSAEEGSGGELDGAESEPAIEPAAEPAVEPAIEPEAEPAVEPAAEPEGDDIRPEFKEAMDSYEDFFDEYVAFMKKYQDSADPTSMMADYADYVTHYTETMEKMDALNTGEMSDAETAYYLEVTTCITQKLTEVASALQA